MPLPELLPITPFTRPVRGEVIVPGSKSLTNRALLLAALGATPVTLTGALFSEDTRLMADALRRLGFTVTADEAALTVRVADQARAFPADAAPVELFVGLAGTAARFLTALCAAAPRGVYRLDGVPQMRKRPMRALIEALRSLGPIAAHSLLMPTLRSRTKRLPLGLLPLRLSKGRGAPRTVRLLAYRDLAAPTIRGSSYLWMPVEAEGCAAAADYFESIGAVPEIVESLRIAVAWMFGDTKLHRRLCADRRASQDAEQAVKREYSSAELDAAMAGEPA
jgi:hypothetical protein